MEALLATEAWVLVSISLRPMIPETLMPAPLLPAGLMVIALSSASARTLRSPPVVGADTGERRAAVPVVIEGPAEHDRVRRGAARAAVEKEGVAPEIQRVDAAPRRDFHRAREGLKQCRPRQAMARIITGIERHGPGQGRDRCRRG